MNVRTIEQIVGGRPELVRLLARIDLETPVREFARRLSKDRASVHAALPAIMAKALEHGVRIGAALGAHDPERPETAVALAQAVDAAERFAEDTVALAKAFASQMSRPDLTDPDPFRDEREWARIYAKKWAMDAEWQQMLGVSEATPTEFPAAFDRFR